MNIGFRFVGDVVVDDIAQFLNIDAPGSDICSHQHTGFTRLETVKGFYPLILGLVAMDRSCGDVLLFKVPGNLVSPVFGS